MEFSNYKTFHEQEAAAAFTQLLQDNRVEFEIVEDRESLDSLYGDKHLARQYFVKIQKQDFSHVDAILAADTQHQLAQIDRGHYLFDFSDEELFEILSKPDEWSVLDFHLAKKILKERGKDINDDTLGLLKKQRINELAKPEDDSNAWIYAGYLFALLGGLIGVFMGLALMTSKKTLPDGRKMYSYSVAHRNHGTRIFFIGITVFLISLMAKIASAEF
jgi:hypothetical protein